MAIRMNQDQIGEAGNWVVFQFSGRGNKNTLAISQYLERKKRKWEIRIYFFNKHTAKVRIGT